MSQTKDWCFVLCKLVVCVAVVALVACSTSSPATGSDASTEGAGSLKSLPRVATGDAPGASPKALAMNKRLGRGINLGNVYEAPINGAWGLSFQKTPELTKVAKNLGFAHVRMPVRWSNHAMVRPPFTINPAFMAQVKSSVDGFIAQGQIVVLNVHHYRQLDGDTLDNGEAAVPSELVDVRFVMLWQQIAQAFKDYSNDQLVFELYNEPHGRMQTGQTPSGNSDAWNNLMAHAMAQVRATNPERIVIVGPTHWNNAYWLDQLRLPNDPHMIVTVHQYEPFNFTHQGSEWVSPRKPTGQTCCSDSQKRQIIGILNKAQTWSQKHKYPIYVGEFGAYAHNNHSEEVTTQRVNFNAFMREEMERRDMSWAYWELASGFGIYDLAAGKTREPLWRSLIPAQ
ncbi:MAG: glycoside hydrolase family 5 protein [Brachymonas sp.]|nr:glycoside hydrolase family 5 protein [Brachymonas sp.]NJS35409.1 glycoside hydrolase family 5 protein [Brachymonas sp.]